MNILNRNRNRRKVSASRMSTSADPCETRSLLCAAALPIAELVDAPVDATDETAQSESAQLVDDSANDESDNAEVGTFDVNSIPVDITAFSEDVAPADGELSEDDLSKLPAGIYTMFNVFSAGGGDVDPEVADEVQPEIAVCNFGSIQQLDENGNPVDVTAESEFDPTVYDVKSLDGWDPSWAFRGVIVDATDDTTSGIPVSDSGDDQPIDWSAEGLEEFDGNGIPDGVVWTKDIYGGIVDDSGLPSDTPVEDGPVTVPIYWFGVADSGATEVDGDGNPVNYMTPDTTNEIDSGVVVTEDKSTLEDVVMAEDTPGTDVSGDGEVAGPTVDGSVDENGDVIQVRYFSMGAPDMSGLQRNPDAVADVSEQVPVTPEVEHGPGRIPLVRIPITRPQTSMFQAPSGTPLNMAAPTTSAQLSPVVSSQGTLNPVEFMSATPSTRLRSAIFTRSARPASIPATDLNSLSPLLGDKVSEESPEGVTIRQQSDDVEPASVEGEAEQQANWVPARERRSIDMFMSDFADDGYIG